METPKLWRVSRTWYDFETATFHSEETQGHVLAHDRREAEAYAALCGFYDAVVDEVEPLLNLGAFR